MFPSALPASLWQFQLKIPPAVHLCVSFWWPAARRLWVCREGGQSFPPANERLDYFKRVTVSNLERRDGGDLVLVLRPSAQNQHGPKSSYKHVLLRNRLLVSRSAGSSGAASRFLRPLPPTRRVGRRLWPDPAHPPPTYSSVAGGQAGNGTERCQ